MEDLIKGELDWHNKANANFNELNTNKIGIQELIKVTGYGVIEGLTVSAQSTPDMSVNVAAGKVDVLSGTELAATGNNNLAITAANATDARVDIVYINPDGTVGYTAGTPSSTPMIPDTPQGAFLLYEINVPANATAITNDNLIDKRKMKFTVDDVAGEGRTTETVKKNADDIKNLSTQMADIAHQALPALFARDIPFTGNKTTILTPNSLWLNINGYRRVISTQQSIDISQSINWDSLTMDYTVASNRAGKDFYIYACDIDALTPKIVLSANSTVPTGYTADNSRKVGGFHCLCVAVGTISGHPLSGYIAGDILPQSVWDLKFRPKSNPEGMVYSPQANIWVDIYLLNGTGTSTASVYNAVITDNRNWMDFVDDVGAISKRLLTDREFQLIATGSNEGTNITGSADPSTTGGHVDTSGRRMISNIGCEDCCGTEWQWLQDQSFRANDDGTVGKFSWKMDVTGGKGQLYTQGTYGDAKLLAGGSWYDGAECGSRGRNADDYRWARSSITGGRAGVEPA